MIQEVLSVSAGIMMLRGYTMMECMHCGSTLLCCGCRCSGSTYHGNVSITRCRHRMLREVLSVSAARDLYEYMMELPGNVYSIIMACITTLLRCCGDAVSAEMYAY